MSPYKILTVFLIQIVLYTLGFYQNAFSVVSKKEFDEFQQDSEALVQRSLIYQNNKSHWNGLWLCTEQKRLEINQQVEFQSESKCQFPFPYTSQYGIQGRLFQALAKVFGSDDRIGHALNSVMMGILLSLFNLILLKLFGISAFLFSLVFSLFSPWLTIMTRNLYWIWWLNMAPFFFSAFYFWYLKPKLKSKHNKLFYGGVAFLVLLKSLAGYEYISTVGLSLIVPPLFYFLSQKEKLNITGYFKVATMTFLSFLVAFIGAMVIHTASLSPIFGSMKNSFAVIKDRASVRTHPDQGLIVRSNQIKKSLLSRVLEKYTTSKIFFFKIKDHYFRTKIWKLFLGMMMIYLFYYKMGMYADHVQLKKSFIITTLFSFTPALSWHILAKPHSHYHPHINFILWHYPATLFAFSVWGFFVGDLLLLIKSKISNKGLGFGIR